jgi:hypothetical protein
LGNADQTVGGLAIGIFADPPDGSVPDPPRQSRLPLASITGWIVSPARVTGTRTLITNNKNKVNRIAPATKRTVRDRCVCIIRFLLDKFSNPRFKVNPADECFSPKAIHLSLEI